MDFFVGSSIFKKIIDKNVSLIPRLSTFVAQDFLVGSTVEAKNEGDNRYLFDGARLIESSFLSHWTWKDAKTDDVVEHFNEKNSDFSLGTFCIFRFNQHEWELSTDKLTQYNIFVWQRGEDYLIANSIPLILKLLTIIGESVSKSAKNISQAMVYGTSFGGKTGYTEINIAQTNQLSSDLKHLGLSDFSYLNELYNGDLDRPYSSSLAEVIDFLKSSLPKLDANSLGGRVLTDLTGGVDSRLVLTLLLNSNFEREEIHTFCLGSDARADKIVADYLTEKYGLTPGTFYSAKSPVPGNAADSIARDVKNFYGTKLADFGDFGEGRIIGQTKLTGYYGELTRLFYEFDECDNEEIAEQLAAEQDLGIFISSEIVNDLKQQIVGQLETFDSLGLSFESKLHAVYILNRNKIHVGMSAHLAGKRRQAFHPLCFPGLVKLSFKLNGAERRANRVAYDIMSSLEPELAVEPMAEKCWPKEFFDESFDYLSYRERLVRNGDSSLVTNRYVYRQKNLLHKKVERTPIDQAFAKRMRKLGIQYHWSLLPDIIHYLNFNIERIKSNSLTFEEFDNVFNIDVINNKLESVNFDAKTHRETKLKNIEAKFLLKLLSAIAWYSSQDDEIKVEYEFSV
tara:strand:+ start:529 stop:2400 length:1872 start_codon:yes stop_codon:yes gene_type:complete